MKCGFSGIGCLNFKNDCNLASLYRSAYCLGADFIYTIGRKYQRQAADTTNATKHIPYYNYLTFEDFKNNIPVGARLIAVENPPNAHNLYNFSHPLQAVYLLGREDNGLPTKILEECWATIKIPSISCLNVAVAGSIILSHRNQQYPLCKT